MKPVKFIALVICALTAMLSVPHVSLWGVSFGSGVGFAASTQITYPSNSPAAGASCPDALLSKYRCVAQAGQFVLAQCSTKTLVLGNEWKERSPPGDYNSCLSRCHEGCIEPYIDLTGPISENVAKGTSTTITSGANYPADQISSHKITFDINGNSKGGRQDCGTNPTCSDTDTYTGWPDGTIVKFNSRATLKDGTVINNPNSGYYSFTLASPGGGGSGGGSAGGLTASPTPVTVNAGATATSQISGGTGAYTATSLAANTATATISGTTLTVTGVAAGQTSITVGDSSSQQKTVAVQVTVTASASPTPPGSPTSFAIQLSPTTVKDNEQTSLTVTFSPVPSLRANSIVSIALQGNEKGSTFSYNIPVNVFCPSKQGVCKTQPVRITVADTYTAVITATQSSSESIQSNPLTITVEPASPTTPTPTSNQCCVIRSGDNHKYQTDLPEHDCLSAKGRFSAINCASVEDSVCAKFCQEEPRRYTAGGSCGFPSSTPDPNLEFTSVCRPGSACKCNTGGSYDTRNVPCNQACFTPSSSYFYLTSAYSAQRTQAIPIGQCTSNPEAIMVSAAVFGQATTAGQYVQQPQILQPAGAYQCLPNENCVCTYIDFSSFSARNSRPTLPGTETAAGWKHPRDVTASAPKKNPNEHVCGTATNATITASLGPAGTTQASGTTSTVVSRLIQAGDTVTITGKVTKLSEACAGYKRTCIAMKPLACEAKNRVLWTTLDYRDCPADFPEDVHKEGGGRKWNKAMIASIVAAAATWGLGSIGAIGPVGGAFTASDEVFWGAVSAGASAAINGMQCGTSYAGANYAPALYRVMRAFADEDRDERRPSEPAKPDGTVETGGAAGSPVGGDSGDVLGTDCDSDGICEPEAGEGFGCDDCVIIGGGATAKPTFTVTGMSAHDAPPKPSTGSSASANTAGVIVSSVLGSIPSCPSAEDIQGCFSVCGRTYETVAGPDPLCGEGGPVIGFSEAEYKCGQGTCGGFASKGVKIEIRGPDGSVAISDTATTDGNGDFSYTFTAPAADGEFVAVLSVPKE